MIELKKDKKGQFFWTVKAKNGEAVAKSSESYATKQAALKAVTVVKNILVAGKIADTTVAVTPKKKK